VLRLLPPRAHLSVFNKGWCLDPPLSNFFVPQELAKGKMNTCKKSDQNNTVTNKNMHRTARAFLVCHIQRYRLHFNTTAIQTYYPKTGATIIHVILLPSSNFSDGKMQTSTHLKI
jgi:hypothetical protein